MDDEKVLRSEEAAGEQRGFEIETIARREIGEIGELRDLLHHHLLVLSVTTEKRGNREEEGEAESEQQIGQLAFLALFDLSQPLVHRSQQLRVATPHEDQSARQRGHAHHLSGPLRDPLHEDPQQIIVGRSRARVGQRQRQFGGHKHAVRVGRFARQRRLQRGKQHVARQIVPRVGPHRGDESNAQRGALAHLGFAVLQEVDEHIEALEGRAQIDQRLRGAGEQQTGALVLLEAVGPAPGLVVEEALRAVAEE